MTTKRLLLLLVAVIAIILLTACGGGVKADIFPDETSRPVYPPISMRTPLPAPAPIPTPTPIPEPPSPPPGYAISRLTGLYIPEEAAMRRPFAVVYNNEPRAMPQSGLMQAEIIYEVLVEGATTRIVAIFQDFDAEMIGPVRSTRHYFTNFALDHGAIMVHHGGSPQGYSAITNNGIPNVDGMRFDGSVFWRDPVRRRDRGLEHSSYTSAERLFNIAEQLDFDMVAANFLGLFEFFDEKTASEPQNLAYTVHVPFTAANVAIFEYNPGTNLYYKYIFGGPQMDDAIGEQVSVTNIIIQIADISHIPGDTAGRRNVALVGSGHGYLVTYGAYSRVYWTKDSPQTPTRWYDAQGNPLAVNRGRTWISVINNRPIFEGLGEEGEYD